MEIVKKTLLIMLITSLLSISFAAEFDNSQLDCENNDYIWMDYKDYFGTYSFTQDVKNEAPYDLNIIGTELPSYVRVISNFRTHSKVLKLHDGDPPTGYEAQISFPPKTEGVVEFYLAIPDTPESYLSSWISIASGTNSTEDTTSIILGTSENQLVAANKIISPQQEPFSSLFRLTPNNWHHVRISFNCEKRLYNVSVDNSIVGEGRDFLPSYNEANEEVYMDQARALIFYSNKVTAAQNDYAYTLYLDAIGIVGEEYEEGDNLKTIKGSNGPCCGDDGDDDYFYNTSSTCYWGVIDPDNKEFSCNKLGYTWFNSSIQGSNGPCCGDDSSEDFSNNSLICSNGIVSKADVCTKNNGVCCDEGMQCDGTVIEEASCYCCVGKCISQCTSEEPINCLTKESCLNISGYWCIDYCQEPLCLKCSIDRSWVCQTKESCERVGSEWYLDSEGNGYCYFKPKNECENNNGQWIVDEEGVGWCFYKTICSPDNIGLCQNKDLCLNASGYWCNDYCSPEPCPACSKNKPWNCLNKTECESVGNYWCVLSGDEWCQQNECEGGEGVCDPTENCETSDDCVCAEGFTCNPVNDKADYKGCVAVSQINLNDSYCDTSLEDCSNSPIDCACPQDKVCDPEKSSADLKGCVTVIGDYNKTTYNDGVCHEGENCNNSLDCACPTDSFCDVNNTRADEKGCVLYENVSDKRCIGEENCETNPAECGCPNGYFCNLTHPRALPNGCVLNKTISYNIHVCKVGDNCLVNPACACAPGEKCDPDSPRSDNIGCIPKLTCPPDATKCCGNRECEQGECSSCPVDCRASECALNGACDLLMGENCETSTDCACAQGYECNISSVYSNKRGCVPRNNAFCGNNVLEPGEDSTNCCVDAGCPGSDLCVPVNGRLVNVTFAKLYYNPKKYVCRSSVCGNNVLEPGEDSTNCCVDAGCEQGECKKVDLDTYNCVVEDSCGNGLVEDYETSINCCVDAGCPNGLTCVDNECVEIKDEVFGCQSDNDCVCFRGCGVISKDYGLTNPACNNQQLKCRNVIPICVNNTCQAELVSVEDNEVIDYVAALKEIKTRLSSFDEVIVNISLSLNKAKDFYESVNNTEKALFFDELLSLVSDYNIDYIKLIHEIDEAIQNPSEEKINYLTNRLGGLENKLIELISRVLSITVGETSVKDLLEGDS